MRASCLRSIKVFIFATAILIASASGHVSADGLDQNFPVQGCDGTVSFLPGLDFLMCQARGGCTDGKHCLPDVPGFQIPILSGVKCRCRTYNDYNASLVSASPEIQAMYRKNIGDYLAAVVEGRGDEYLNLVTENLDLTQP